ncbi:putative allergen Ole e 1 [Helianthus annuus]|uniref:Pollen allergen Ole e 1 family n=1 Tax=Helianthus annuus TaxID=4232 RepID=A0A251TB97_HELAN|nr:olee1-like protein [Helianthus annuus]KAF5782399.1 putative pollen allergen Ole e 1 family [Helianthus annuus]KAJ0501888.1 putative allergen Ole e 1 [Helianthus annuus]KAJ0517816.1 putative allergen Ole e 1 [Helianthus annuus]KAJ0685833.1 putative allergen Ole e 1 [Helianthus annuus]KAJ0689701.1 putative allergen Ole e 1 [Helianthus annuus]
MTNFAAILAPFVTILSIISPVTSRATAATSPAPAPSLTSKESFIVQGKVYCDPCRIQFPTKLSYPLPNTKVVLRCTNRDTGAQTYTAEGKTDAKGMYTLNATGDHEEEICDVRIKESPNSKCPELMDDESIARVSLTDKNGVRGKARMANPIGFMVKEIDPRCKEVLAEIGIIGI